MTAAYIEIGYGKVAAAGLLLLIDLALSVALRLGLERRLLVAGLRMSAQLLLVGLVLEWVFALRQPVPVVGLALVMALLAGVTAVRRTGRRFPGIYWSSIVSVLGASFAVTGAALVGILEVEPWFDPQYLIPLLGMLLGNALTGISLGLDRFLEGCLDHRRLVETLLCHGANRWEAVHGEIREALRVGMIPTVNSMMVMGIISLPGMMTGQILAGADPIDAVRYQIVIMFMIAATVGLATLGTILLAYRVLFPPGLRPRFDRLETVPSRDSSGWGV